MGNSVIGLIIGEGSFQVALYQRDRNRFGIQSRPQFTIEMHIEDQDVVRFAKDMVGVGYFNTYESNNGARWEVMGSDDCDELEEYIENNSGELWDESLKSNSFERWKSLRDDRKELIRSEDGMRELIDRAANVNDWGERKTDWHSIVDENV